MGRHHYAHDPTAGIPKPGKPKTFAEYMGEYEALVLLCHLEANNWNKSATARELDVTKQHVLILCKKHNLHAPTKEQLILPVLRANGWNSTRTARQLNLAVSTVLLVAKKHGRNQPTSHP